MIVFEILSVKCLTLICVWFDCSFLNVCRPKSVSMGNAIKYVKLQISQIPQDMADTKVCIHQYTKDKDIHVEQVRVLTFSQHLINH